MRVIPYLLMWLLLPTQLFAEDRNEDRPVKESELKEYFASAGAVDKQNQLIAEAKAKLEDAKRGRVSKRFEKSVNRRELSAGKYRYEFKADENKAKTIAALENQVKRLKAHPPLPRLVISENGLEVGQVGACPPTHYVDNSSHQYQVLQVIDKAAALITVTRRTTGPASTGSGIPGKRVRIVNKSYDTIVWLKRDTTGLVDGKLIEMRGLFKVSGTTQYARTDGASKTVIVLESFDITPYLPKPQPRVWNDATGTFSVKATYVDVEGGNVNLRKPDGKEISVPIKRLCDADKKYLSTLKGE